MIPYQSKQKKLPGTNLTETTRHAWKIIHNIEKRTRRKPYIRSAYFKKEKIFLDFFWPHLRQKKPKDRFRRIQYLAAAIDVIEHSRNKPVSKHNPNKKTEVLHRFAGITKERELFYVQIKENKRSKRKYFMSCFSPD